MCRITCCEQELAEPQPVARGLWRERRRLLCSRQRSFERPGPGEQVAQRSIRWQEARVQFDGLLQCHARLVVATKRDQRLPGQQRGSGQVGTQRKRGAGTGERRLGLLQPEQRITAV